MAQASEENAAGRLLDLLEPSSLPVSPSDGILSFYGTNFGREYSNYYNSLTSNGPDGVVLHFGADDGLEHLLVDFALVSDCACLQVALVKEVK
jgi:hypothetical protein